jgi:MFS family permease
MLAESVPSEKVGSAFGLLQSMDSAGAIAGPLLALWILRGHDVRTVFWLAAVPGGLTVLIAALGIRELRKGRAVSREKREAAASWRDLPGSFYYVLMVVALFSLGNSSDMFLVLRAQNVGIGVAFAPLLGLVFNITYTAASWPAGYLSDRLSRRGIAAAGYLVFAGVYFAFAWAPSKGVIWVAMAVYGLFYALTAPVLKALVSETVSASVRGRAFGVFDFTTSVTTLLASLITGEIWKHYGAPLPFALSAGLALVCAVLLLASPRPRDEGVGAAGAR